MSIKSLTFLCLLSIFSACFVYAGIPQTITYQGYLKHSDGTPVTTAVTMTFSLYSSVPPRNNPVWHETKSITPSNGIYNTLLGSQTPFSIPFDVPYQIGISINDSPESFHPLSSVPYAFKSGCTPGDMISCYTGSPATLNTGICRAGVRTCPTDGNSFGSCIGETKPDPVTGCNEPSCTDGVKNGRETDIDCGAVCLPCTLGKGCLSNTDCQSSYCNSNNICAIPTCNDAIQNGSETSVDCGGTCPPCGLTKGCVINTDCLSGYCSGNTCQLKPLGTACGNASECTSGYCADGFCCNTACNSTCQACNSAKTGMTSGTCSFIPAGTDPDNECTAQSVATCGFNGYCSGSASCAYYASGTVAVPASCLNSTTLTLPSTCSGNGTVNSGGTQSCFPYICSGSACKTSCTTQSDCTTGYTCSANVCKKSNGSTCTVNIECASGFCTDGLCCESACNGFCEACNQAGRPGFCDPIPAGQDPANECALSCNGARACQ